MPAKNKDWNFIPRQGKEDLENSMKSALGFDRKATSHLEAFALSWQGFWNQFHCEQVHCLRSAPIHCSNCCWLEKGRSGGWWISLDDKVPRIESAGYDIMCHNNLRISFYLVLLGVSRKSMNRLQYCTNRASEYYGLKVRCIWGRNELRIRVWAVLPQRQRREAKMNWHNPNITKSRKWFSKNTKLLNAGTLKRISFSLKVN